VYGDPEFAERLEEYHAAAAGAHVGHTKIDGIMPEGGRLAPPPAPEPEPEPVAAGPYAGYGQPQGYGAPPGNGQAQSGPWQGGPRYGYPTPPPGGAGNGVGNGSGYGSAPGYPPPPVAGWGRPEPEPGADTPTQAYGPGPASRPEPGADTPTQACGPDESGHSGNGNGQAARDSGETSPAAWYPAEPRFQQPDTGPVQIVGESTVDTPPTGEPQVGQAHDAQAHGEAHDDAESRTGQENGQAERGADAESTEDEDRPGRA
jgi:hypothetical protein